MKRMVIVFFVVGVVFFGTFFVQNANAQKVDANLNGTWTATIEGVKLEYKFNNGNCEQLLNSLRTKGAYTTENGKITFKSGDIHGDGFSEFMLSLGINSDWGLKSKWYTTNEFILAVKPNLLKLGLSEKEVNEFIVGLISDNITLNYSVDSKTLILIDKDKPEPIILTKK